MHAKSTGRNVCLLSGTFGLRSIPDQIQVGTITEVTPHKAAAGDNSSVTSYDVSVKVGDTGGRYGTESLSFSTAEGSLVLQNQLSAVKFRRMRAEKRDSSLQDSRSDMAP